MSRKQQNEHSRRILELNALHQAAQALKPEELNKVRGIMLAAYHACQDANVEPLTAQIALLMGLQTYLIEHNKK